jgi:hypothetical protein
MEEEKQFQNLSGAAIRNQTVWKLPHAGFLAKNFLTFVFYNTQRYLTFVFFDIQKMET